MDGTTSVYKLIKSTVRTDMEDVFELLLERFTMGYKRQSGNGYSTYYCWMTDDEKKLLEESWMRSIGDLGETVAPDDEEDDAVVPDILPEGTVYVPELEVEGDA